MASSRAITESHETAAETPKGSDRIMGYGADIQIRNDRSVGCTLSVGDVQGMYDHGDQGSDVSSLRTTGDQPYLNAGQTVPPGNGTQYIEASEDDAEFSLVFGAIEAGPFGTVRIVMSEGTYDYSIEGTDRPEDFNVDIDNDEQATIVIAI